MTDTTKTILIVGGVAAGAYVLIEFVIKPRTASQAAPSTSRPADASWISGLLNFGASVVNTFGGTAPRPAGTPAGNPSGVSDPTWGTTGIDPETGGVVLGDGQTYGPFLPSGGGILR